MPPRGPPPVLSRDVDELEDVPSLSRLFSGAGTRAGGSGAMSSITSPMRWTASRAWLSRFAARKLLTIPTAPAPATIDSGPKVKSAPLTADWRMFASVPDSDAGAF